MQTTDSNLRVRRATETDAPSVIKTHYAAVHETASSSYAPAILDEWSGANIDQRIENWTTRPNASAEITVVAELDGQIVGFGGLIPETRELCAVYVSPNLARRGIGTALMKEIEKIAESKGVLDLWLDSSLNAEKFYLAHGFERVSAGEHTLRSGMKMACIKMTKRLTNRG
jgi:putative acetyltransferase